MADLLFPQACISNGLLQGDGGKGCSIAHETQIFFLDMVFRFNSGKAANLGAQAQFLIGLVKADAGAAMAQGFQHRSEAVPQGGNNTHAGDNGSSHGLSFLTLTVNKERAAALAGWHDFNGADIDMGRD